MGSLVLVFCLLVLSQQVISFKADIFYSSLSLNQENVIDNEEVYAADHNVFDLQSPTGANPDHDFPKVRRRRAIRFSKITFINKSGMEVNVFYMDYSGYRRLYFDLRLNEKKIIRSKVGTTWLAYDKDNHISLLLNKKYTFLVYYNHLDRDIQVIITAKSNNKVAPQSVVIPEKFIEVMVIADSTVVKKHGQNTEKYILTLMNAVNRLFQDKSFGIKMQVVATRIKLLEKDPANLKIVAGAPKNSMRSACLYASTLNHYSDENSDHFDFAVVLTRKRFGYAGFTPIYRMCDVQLGCTIVLERGFENAHVIAHEIGHSLGIDHDGENNDCKKHARQGSLMAPTLWSRFDKYFWTECSRKQVKETIRYFTCLNDRPQYNITKYSTELPGVHFNFDEQCAFYIGSHYRGCHGHYFRWDCRFLYCAPYWSSSKRDCFRYSLPPLDGTQCKYGKNWCIKGKCFPHGRFNYYPIHGGLSTWGSWSECSASCGIGIRHRSRMCDNPSPKYDGKDCEGERSDVKICNIKPCEVEITVKDKRNAHCNSLGKGSLHWYTETDMIGSIESVVGLNCTFDNVKNCSWQQESKDNFDWQKHKGSTPSYGTGPREDHTFGNATGHYMFIEASDDPEGDRRLKGFKARLISPIIKSPEVCFSFFYHMFGSHVGGLNVYKQTGKEEHLLWHRTKDMNDQWFFANVSITSKQAFSIIIEGVRGVHYQGDIAIDDLSVNFGRCKTETVNDKVPCKITCTDVNKTIFTDEVLPDTFSCYDDNRTDICLEEKCEKLGCDLQFGSNKTIDNCKICGGDGSSCTLNEGNATVTVNDVDETELMMIPPGSTNLNFVIFAALNAVVGLRESATNKVYFQKKKGENPLDSFYTNILGCTYRFERIEDKEIYVVQSEGPSNGIVQLVIAAAKQPQINLQYRMFQSTYYYEWKKKSQSECSESCNDDKVCMKMPIGEEAESYNCPTEKTMRLERYIWHASNWSECSKTCGLSVKTRKVTCRKFIENEKVNESPVVEASSCTDKKPVVAVHCKNTKCRNKARICREKSPLCGMLKKRGVCEYNNVKQMCCKTCSTE